MILPSARSWTRWDHWRARCSGRSKLAASLSVLLCSSSINFHSCIMKMNSELSCIIREFTSPSMERRSWKRITFAISWSLLDNGKQRAKDGDIVGWISRALENHWKQGRESASFINWERRTGRIVPGFQPWLLDDHCMVRRCSCSALVFTPVQPCAGCSSRAIA